MSSLPTFLVLVTGHAAAGKTTVAPKLAEQLDATWISRDAIHSKVYSGWKPAHPALTSAQYDPQIGGNTYFEGAVVWDIFLWMFGTVTPQHPVVADTPFNHPFNRDMFYEASASWPFPMVEVALEGDSKRCSPGPDTEPRSRECTKSKHALASAPRSTSTPTSRSLMKAA